MHLVVISLYYWLSMCDPPGLICTSVLIYILSQSARRDGRHSFITMEWIGKRDVLPRKERRVEDEWWLGIRERDSTHQDWVAKGGGAEGLESGTFQWWIKWPRQGGFNLITNKDIELWSIGCQWYSKKLIFEILNFWILNRNFNQRTGRIHCYNYFPVGLVVFSASCSLTLSWIASKQTAIYAILSSSSLPCLQIYILCNTLCSILRWWFRPFKLQNTSPVGRDAVVVPNGGWCA